MHNVHSVHNAHYTLHNAHSVQCSGACWKHRSCSKLGLGRRRDWQPKGATQCHTGISIHTGHQYHCHQIIISFTTQSAQTMLTEQSVKVHTGHDVSFRSVLGSVSLSSSHNSTDYPKCSDTVDGTETGGNTKQWARCQNRKGLFQVQIQIKMQIQIQQWVRCQDRKGLFHLSWSSVIWIGCAKDQAFLFMFLFLFLVNTKKVYFIFHKVLLFGCDISHAFLFIQAASLRKMLSVGSQWD